MAASMKLQRVIGFGCVLFRNATLFIRPRVQNPVILKHQLTGNTHVRFNAFTSVTILMTFFRVKAPCEVVGRSLLPALRHNPKERLMGNT
jgi:hypothetical protein